MADHYEEQRVQQSVDYVSPKHKKHLGEKPYLIMRNIEVLQQKIIQCDEEKRRAIITIENLRKQLR